MIKDFNSWKFEHFISMLQNLSVHWIAINQALILIYSANRSVTALLFIQWSWTHFTISRVREINYLTAWETQCMDEIIVQKDSSIPPPAIDFELTLILLHMHTHMTTFRQMRLHKRINWVTPLIASTWSAFGFFHFAFAFSYFSIFCQIIFIASISMVSNSFDDWSPQLANAEVNTFPQFVRAAARAQPFSSS